jgi:hypothetical protein
MATKQKNNKTVTNDTVIKHIRDAIEQLEYGTVMIKVHQSRVIQIDVTERKRYDDTGHLEGGGGI